MPLEAKVTTCGPGMSLPLCQPWLIPLSLMQRAGVTPGNSPLYPEHYTVQLNNHPAGREKAQGKLIYSFIFQSAFLCCFTETMNMTNIVHLGVCNLGDFVKIIEPIKVTFLPTTSSK